MSFLLYELPFTFYNKGSLIESEMHPDYDPQVPTSFHFLSTGTTNATIPSIFLWILGLKLRASFSHGKHLAN